MANAKRDDNSIVTLLAVSNADGSTPVTLYADPTTHRLLTSAADVAVSELADGTDGELITWDSSGVPATVAAGTAGQVLTSNGAGAEPTFQTDIDMSAGGRLFGGGIQANHQTLAADTNLVLDENDSVVSVTLGSSSDNTITLPACSGNEGMLVTVYITDGTGTNNAVVTRAGSDTISNGSADLSNTTVTLGDTGDLVVLQCVNSSTWAIIQEVGTTVA